MSLLKGVHGFTATAMQGGPAALEGLFEKNRGDDSIKLKR